MQTFDPARPPAVSSFRAGVLTLALTVFTACSAPVPRVDTAATPSRDRSTEVLHEWSKVISVRATPAGSERETIGFLDRRFTLSESAGTTYVLDHLHEEKGFIIDAGTAYLLERRGSAVAGIKDLGRPGLDIAIQRILGVTGEIEIEPVQAR